VFDGPSVQTRWSLVGRAAEFARLLECASGSGTEAKGLVFGGVAGIGKSRLLRDGLAVLDPSRMTVLTANATAGTASLPFGALAQVLPADQPAGLSPAGLLRWAVDNLRLEHRHSDIVLAVDDAHLLDPVSAALVSYMVQSGHARLLATVRSGEAAPDPIRALWTGGVVERLDLGPLTEADTGILLAQVLGDDVDTSSVARLWRLSQGNALLLRELVLAARAAGEIEQSYGLWRWTGRLSLAPSLSEVIDARIGLLSPEVRTAVEYVAFGEPIGLPLLSAAGLSDAIEIAEERQLVHVTVAGRRSNVRLTHPIYGEVARQRCPATRARRLLAHLAHLVEAIGARRSDDLLRVATWRLDSGTARDPEQLLRACRQAFASYDIPLATRLGRAALAAGGGFDASETLAVLLMFTGQPDEAVRILDEAAPLITHDGEWARWHASRGIITYWGLGDESSRDALRAAADKLPPAAGRFRVQAIEAMMRVHHNDQARLRELVDAVLASPVADAGHRALSISAVGHLRAAQGKATRTMREMATIEADAAQWRSEMPYFQLAVEVARGTAMILATDLAAVDAVIADEYAGMAETGDFHLGSGYLTVVRAQACRLRGRVRDAVRYARLARARLITGRIFTGLACAELAHAAALTSDPQTAVAAMAEADQQHLPTMSILYPHLEFARVWTATATGNQQNCLDMLRRLLDRLRADGFAAYEVFALHDLVRLGRPHEAVEPLARLTGQVDGAFAPVAALHARAAAAGDIRALLAVAADFAALGLMLFAAEAAPTTAVQAGRRTRSEHTAEATTLRMEYLNHCDPDVSTPGLNLSVPTLTDRERQIAQLASTGTSSGEIANGLFLSRRTVDNHLMRAYVKLGVTRRSQLRAALRSLPIGPTQ
jgi:DNA-binding CsgD family transcriptional regulator